jgi:DNA-binding NarL/FixJ family response regulator
MLWPFSGGVVSLDQGVFPQTKLVNNKIRCLLVDDHVLLRQGVRRLLQDEPDFEVVGEAANAAEALRKAREHRPDVVLMGIGVSGEPPFGAAGLIQSSCPETRLVFLTLREHQTYALQGAAAQAEGFTLKDTPAPKLVSLMREAYRAGKNQGRDVVRQFMEDPGLSPQVGPLRRGSSTLTPRELEVIKLLAEGNSVRKAAGLLGLSTKTVEAHKFNLMRKLDIHNKVQLVKYAIQKRIVEMPAEG